MAVAYRTRRLSRMELACAVPFYGRQHPLANVAKIEAPLLFHFAELDLHNQQTAILQALKANDQVMRRISGGNYGLVIWLGPPVMTKYTANIGKGH